MVTSKYSYKNKRSTTASGHVGTGIGTHDKSWPHYNPPQKGDQRLKHTQFDYADATKKIAVAKATSGSVQVNAVVHTKTVGLALRERLVRRYERGQFAARPAGMQSGEVGGAHMGLE